jgi:hypothetical protein
MTVLGRENGEVYLTKRTIVSKMPILRIIPAILAEKVEKHADVSQKG